MSAPYIPLGDDWQVNAVTPWFPGSVKPVRPGVYQRRIARSQLTGFSRWDGVWYHIGITADRAAWQQTESKTQNARWRGLAQDPKGKP